MPHPADSRRAPRFRGPVAAPSAGGSEFGLVAASLSLGILVSLVAMATKLDWTLASRLVPLP